MASSWETTLLLQLPPFFLRQMVVKIELRPLLGCTGLRFAFIPHFFQESVTSPDLRIVTCLKYQGFGCIWSGNRSISPGRSSNRGRCCCFEGTRLGRVVLTTVHRCLGNRWNLSRENLHHSICQTWYFHHRHQTYFFLCGYNSQADRCHRKQSSLEWGFYRSLWLLVLFHNFIFISIGVVLLLEPPTLKQMHMKLLISFLFDGVSL